MLKILPALLISGLLIGSAHATNYAYGFSCECRRGNCEGLENLTVKIDPNPNLTISVGNSDWEFNESFEVNVSSDPVPEAFESEYARFENISRGDYLPAVYAKGSLLLKRDMLEGGTRINGISKTTFVGSVIVINSKGKEQLAFGCKRVPYNSL